MQGMGAVFRCAQGFQRRNIEVHFRRRFAAWSHQEFEIQPVDIEFLSCLGDRSRRRDNCRAAGSKRNTQPVADISLCIMRE